MSGETQGGASNTHTLLLRFPMEHVTALGIGTSRHYRPTRYHCVRCLNEIPPGKPGRKCKQCRKGTPNRD